MRKEEFHFLSNDNRTKIHGVKWMPENQKIQAVLQIAHGMVEYIERYEEFAEYMAAKGFLVVGNDHLGHGQSVRASSERGYFAKDWGSSSDILIQDMRQIYQIAHLQYPDLPYFMLGHSMGSYILRRYVAYYPKGLDGVIVCGTGTELKAATYFGMFLCRLLGAFKGGHYRSDFIQRAAFGRRFRAFDMTGQDLSRSWLSKNEDSIREYQKNPKSQFLFTVNGYYALFSTVNYDSHRKNIRKIPTDLPIFFISGEDDPVGHMGKAVKTVYHQYAKAGIRDLSIKIYENDRHELLQETNRETVFYDIYRWCIKRMPDTCKKENRCLRYRRKIMERMKLIKELAVIMFFILSIQYVSVRPNAVYAAGDVVAEITDAEDDNVVIEDDDKPYLAFGADLNNEQKKSVLSMMGIDAADLDKYEVTTVTNQEEHEYLDAYMDKSTIGTKALSSVVIVKREKGNGISISTKNISYCTVGMYKNALATAGLQDADVIVAGPFPISGTAALIGAMKAYADMQGTDVNEESLDAAMNEIVVTGDLNEALPDGEQTEEFIAYVKQQIAEKDLTDADEIKGVITDAMKKFNISLTEDQEQQVMGLMQKISALDLDADRLKAQASSVYENISQFVDDNKEGIFGFLQNLLQKILEFLSGFVSKN